MTEAKTGGDLAARIKGNHRKLGRDKGCFCPESQRKNSPTGNLDIGLWNCERIGLCCFEPPSF